MRQLCSKRQFLSIVTCTTAASHDSEHLHDNRGREVREEHGQHHDAESAADEQANDAIELGKELGADKLRLEKENRISSD